jgi:hypothetical protein
MRLGVVKTGRESAKSPDEFEAPGFEPVFRQKRQAIDYAGKSLKLRALSLRRHFWPAPGEF